jgi:hypothetical protein
MFDLIHLEAAIRSRYPAGGEPPRLVGVIEDAAQAALGLSVRTR